MLFNDDLNNKIRESILNSAGASNLILEDNRSDDEKSANAHAIRERTKTEKWERRMSKVLYCSVSGVIGILVGGFSFWLFFT